MFAKKIAEASEAELQDVYTAIRAALSSEQVEGDRIAESCRLLFQAMRAVQSVAKKVVGKDEDNAAQVAKDIFSLLVGFVDKFRERSYDEGILVEAVIATGIALTDKVARTDGEKFINLIDEASPANASLFAVLREAGDTLSFAAATYVSTVAFLGVKGLQNAEFVGRLTLAGFHFDSVPLWHLFEPGSLVGYHVITKMYSIATTAIGVVLALHHAQQFIQNEEERKVLLKRVSDWEEKAKALALDLHIWGCPDGELASSLRKEAEEAASEIRAMFG
ncbi:hypothetical protein DFJ73DRAFT_768159 [Zopfochytrium polystomum]|nr:hypothetical protein DFJ73DRAFT_768159 [Zopfochytrium polystomum]